MSRRLLVLLVALAAVLLLPASASAHVLIKDRVGDTGALLHLNPDDDPIAGERVTLFFDIRDDSITPKSSQAKLTITDDQGLALVVPSELSGSSVSARYVFPAQGLYEVKLVISSGGKTTHSFVESQRVSRGSAADTAAPSAPAWAKAGVVVSVSAGIITATIAFRRRKAISKYSAF